MNQVYSIMKKHKVFFIIRQQPSIIIQTLSKYLTQSFQKVPLNSKQKERYINALIIFTIQQIDKQRFTRTQQLWMRMLLVEMFVNLAERSILTEQLIQFLNSLCIFKPLQLKINPENVSQSFFSIRQLFQSSKTTNDVGDYENNQLTNKIIEDISLLVRKKLNNHEFFSSFGQNQNQQHQLLLNHQNYKCSQQKVWKIINHFKSYDGIIKNYKSMEQYNVKIKPFMLATFYLIGLDVIKMYPYILKFIQFEVSLIQDKYNSIKEIPMNKQKQKRRKILYEIYQSSLFIQAKNLIKQLQIINWTVLYVFFGVHHVNDMQLKLPNQFILNTGHMRLDVIHKIGIQVELLKSKRQKEKENLRKLSFGMNKSECFNNVNGSIKIKQFHSTQDLPTNNNKEVIQNTQTNQDIKSFSQQKEAIVVEKNSHFNIDDTGQSESFIDDRQNQQTYHDV